VSTVPYKSLFSSHSVKYYLNSFVKTQFQLLLRIFATKIVSAKIKQETFHRQIGNMLLLYAIFCYLSLSEVESSSLPLTITAFITSVRIRGHFTAQIETVNFSPFNELISVIYYSFSFSCSFDLYSFTVLSTTFVAMPIEKTTFLP
jgi:hypothetical protein